MRKTFPFKREKTNGFFPYICFDKNKNKRFLFEVSQKTPYKTILKIQDKFNSNDLLFATTVNDFMNKTFSIDATDAYNLLGKGCFTLLFFNGFDFCNSKIKDVLDEKGNPKKKIVGTFNIFSLTQTK